MTFVAWMLNPEQLFTFYTVKNQWISGPSTVKMAINIVPFQDNLRLCGFIHYSLMLLSNASTYYSVWEKYKISGILTQNY